MSNVSWVTCTKPGCPYTDTLMF